MYRNIQKINLLILVLLCQVMFFSWVQAHDDKSCEGALLVLPSGGQSGEEFKRLSENSRKITDVAKRLGYSVPPHQVIFAPSAELLVLTGNGGHAAPHWFDGLRIVQGLKSGGGILEFVLPGCPTCRSYYRDTTPEHDQASVIEHVMGHNHYGVNSPFESARQSDAIKASLELAEKMNFMLEKNDPDQVAIWYQFLNSFYSWQDYAVGTFDHPDVFDPQKVVDKKGERVIHKGKKSDPYKNMKHPFRPTPNGLQYLVKNLPNDAPEWQKELTRLFEEKARATPPVVQTKMMNEGWATFSQLLLSKYSERTTSDDLVKLAALLSGVAYPSISNPYWLGLEAWKNLYRRFKEENKDKFDITNNLNEEMDREFVKYATDIIKRHNDYQFVKVAFDEYWVDKYNLYLSRQLTREEFMKYYDKLPPGTQPDDANVVLTRDANRVLTYIQQQFNHRLKFARVYVENERGLNENILHLKHDDFKGIPLKLGSMVKTMYVLTLMKEKSVAMDTILSKEILEVEVPDHRWWPPHWGPSPIGWEPPTRKVKLLNEDLPVRFVVTKSGKVKVEQLEDVEIDPKHAKEFASFFKQLEDSLVKVLEEYKFDISGTVNTKLSDSMLNKLNKFMESSSYNSDQIVRNVISHAPTAADALHHFYETIDRRFLRSVELALAGKINPKISEKGVHLPVLPDVPSFELDMGIRQKIIEAMPPAPIDHEVYGSPVLQGLDEKSDLGSGSDKMPGDVFVKPKGQGQGEGKGKGDPNKGDPKEDPDKPDDFGGDAEDPTKVIVPLELWGELLKEYLELPNLKKIGGESKKIDTEFNGTIRRPSGIVQYDQMGPEALAKGLARWKIENQKRKEEGLEPLPKPSTIQLIKDGFKYIDTSDYVVKDRTEVQLPEHKAVMIFVIDLTGSMMGKAQELSKRFSYMLQGLLKATYDDVDIRYVGYDMQAHEFSEEEIWTTFLGGGNADSVGFIKAKEILDEDYDDSWNKYVVGIGDGGSTDTEATIAAMNELMEDLQYQLWVHNDVRGWHSDIDFVQQIKAQQDQHRWFGFDTLNSEADILQVLKRQFSKDKDEGED